MITPNHIPMLSVIANHQQFRFGFGRFPCGEAISLKLKQYMRLRQSYLHRNNGLRFIVSLLLLLPVVVNSQIVWEEIPTPEGVTVWSFEISNTNEIYIGTESGVYQSSDLGQSWELTGLSDQVIKELENNPNGNLIAIASGSTHIYLGDFVWDLLNDQGLTNMRTVYDKMFGGSYDGIFRSLNNANSWEQTYNSINGGEFISDFAAPNPDTIYAGATNYLGGFGVYRSTNGGVDWTTYGLINLFINSMGIDNSGEVYAGAFGHYETGQGGLYRLDKQNNIWDTLMSFPYITSIELSDEDIIYLGFRFSGSEDGGGVMHSDDHGDTWIIDTTGLFSSGINELIIDNSNFVYAFGGYPDQNLYRTSFPVGKAENIYEQAGFSIISYPNPSNDKVIFKYKVSNSGDYTIIIYNQNNKTVKQFDLGYKNSGQHMFEVTLGELPSGVYFYSLEQNGKTIATNKMIIL